MNKGLPKYISVIEYFNKALIVLSATIGEVFITSFARVIDAPVGLKKLRKLLKTIKESIENNKE